MTEVVIVGGGIAGLWLLSQLKQQGYDAHLLEAHALGAGQTILSQGIIHGGTKYLVKQALTSLAKHIKTMPTVWQACLTGSGEVDLQHVCVLATHQHLWIPPQLGSQFVGFLASAAMQSRVTKLKRDAFPLIFQTPDFHGQVYSLNEPVLDVYSLLQTLREQYKDSLIKIDLENTQFIFKQEKLEKIITAGTEIQARQYIFTAGAHNAAYAKQFQLDTIKTQRRPLRMLLLKSLPYPLYAHCVDRHFKPRLTITSYPTTNGYAWYMGGEIAEKGAKMTEEETYHYGLRELKQLFPWLALDKLNWKTCYIDRAEPWQPEGKIPPLPSFTAQHNCLFAWPVKLAYAPLLAKEILTYLQTKQVLPRAQTTAFALPKPAVALPPWQEETGWN